MSAIDLDVDLLIVGGGIAGASLAWALAPTMRVALVERESSVGAHATGRSGAMYIEGYGAPEVRALNRAAKSFLDCPPPGFVDSALLGAACGAMTLARVGHRDMLARLLERPDMIPVQRLIEPEQAVGIVPVLRASAIEGAVFEEGASHIDVSLMLDSFVRGARREGAVILTGVELFGLERKKGSWYSATGAGRIKSSIVVNAAGAWAERVGRMAGASKISLQPLRRTGLIIPVSHGMDATAWPIVLDVAEQFYFKPEGSGLMISPADEEPSEPIDAFADDLDVAIAIDRVQGVADLPVVTPPKSWAGLRTFAKDRLPVIGFDALADSMFWLAGQGGFGIQTSWAAAVLARALICEEDFPEPLVEQGIDAWSFSPFRF